MSHPKRSLELIIMATRTRRSRSFFQSYHRSRTLQADAGYTVKVFVAGIATWPVVQYAVWPALSAYLGS